MRITGWSAPPPIDLANLLGVAGLTADLLAAPIGDTAHANALAAGDIDSVLAA